MRNSLFGFCYPGYRYCGPGCSGRGAPTNPVDLCCYYHDRCYSQYGRSRYCDELFQRCISRHTYMNNKMGRDARLFSRAIQLKNFFF